MWFACNNSSFTACRVPLAGGLICCSWKGLSVVGTMQFIPPLNSCWCFSEEALECSLARLYSQLLPAALSLACGRGTQWFWTRTNAVAIPRIHVTAQPQTEDVLNDFSFFFHL